MSKVVLVAFFKLNNLRDKTIVGLLPVFRLFRLELSRLFQTKGQKKHHFTLLIPIKLDCECIIKSKSLHSYIKKKRVVMQNRPKMISFISADKKLEQIQIIFE